MKSALPISFTTAGAIAVVLLVGVTTLSVVTGATHSATSQVHYGIALFLAGIIPIALLSGALYVRLQSDSSPPSEAEVDSVYYLGFLITLITLICTVISIAAPSVSRTDGGTLSDGGTLASVSFAFALSLSATALALFSRITLSAMRDRKIADASIEGAEQHLQAIVLQLDLAYSRLTTTISQAIGALETAAETQGVQLTVQLGVITGAIQQELRGFVQRLSDDVSSSGLTQSMSTATASLRASVEEMAAIMEIMKPVRGVAAEVSQLAMDMASATLTLRQSLGGFAESLRSAGQSIASLSTDQLQETAKRLTVHLDVLSQGIERSNKLVSDGLATSSSSLTTTTHQMQDASDALGHAFTGLSRELARTAEVLADQVK